MGIMTAGATLLSSRRFLMRMCRQVGTVMTTQAALFHREGTHRSPRSRSDVTRRSSVTKCALTAESRLMKAWLPQDVCMASGAIVGHRRRMCGIRRRILLRLPRWKRSVTTRSACRPKRRTLDLQPLVARIAISHRSLNRLSVTGKIRNVRHRPVGRMGVRISFNRCICHRQCRWVLIRLRIDHLSLLGASAQKDHQQQHESTRRDG